MIRRAIALALGLLLAAGCNLPWTSNTSQTPKGQEIAIASDMPLSGAAGFDARPLSDAIALAIHDHATVGGYRLTYLPFDDALIGQFNNDKAEQNVKLMISDSRVVALIGPFNSEIAQVEIPLGNKANLVMISPSNTADCLTFVKDPCVQETSPINNYFRIPAQNSAQATAGARFARQKLGLKRFAVLDDNSGYGRDLADAFASGLIAIGGSVAMRRSFSTSSNDYTGLLHDAVVAKAEAVFVGGAGISGACRIRADMVDAFPNAYMIGDDGLSGQSCVSDAGGGANDHLLMMVSDSQPANDSKVYKEFKAHNIPPVSYVFGAYDCAQIIIDAVERVIKSNGGRVPTRREVLDAVASTHDFVGTSGTFTFQPNGDASNPAVSVYRVEGGKWTFWRSDV